MSVSSESSQTALESLRVEAIARFQFDVPAATPGADEPPFADRFAAGMDNASAHHDCPVKRARGRCGCALND